jgi:hypothetical protein
MALSSQPFADIGIADPDGEQAGGDGKHQNVHHGVWLRVLDMARSASPSPGKADCGESIFSGIDLPASAHNQWR